jgi:hypothetical protein
VTLLVYCALLYTSQNSRFALLYCILKQSYTVTIDMDSSQQLCSLQDQALAAMVHDGAAFEAQQAGAEKFEHSSQSKQHKLFFYWTAAKGIQSSVQLCLWNGHADSAALAS